MDQAAKTAQEANGPPAANGTHLCLSPLGEPMSKASILLWHQDRLRWLLQYWLEMTVIGILRGEDRRLMVLRVYMETTKISNRKFLLQFLNARNQFQRANMKECMRQWREMTLASEEAQPYLRDLERMLVDKGRKTREYLRREEEWMTQALQGPNAERAKRWFGHVDMVRYRLKLEESAAAKE